MNFWTEARKKEYKSRTDKFVATQKQNKKGFGEKKSMKGSLVIEEKGMVRIWLPQMKKDTNQTCKGME